MTWATLYLGRSVWIALVYGVRGGRLTDRNISLREQRIRFAAVAITSILTGLAVPATLDVPAEMVALLASIAVGVTCGWMVILWGNLGAPRHRRRCRHRAAARLGAALLVVWPLAVLIAWSRVQVGDHPGPGPRDHLPAAAVASLGSAAPTHCPVTVIFFARADVSVPAQAECQRKVLWWLATECDCHLTHRRSELGPCHDPWASSDPPGWGDHPTP